MLSGVLRHVHDVARVHRRDVVAHEPAGRVDVVDRRVHDDVDRGPNLGRPPMGMDAAKEERPADLARVDRLLDRGVLRVEGAHEAHLDELPSGRDLGVHDPPRVVDVDPEGLLAEHRLRRPRCRRRRGPAWVGSGDAMRTASTVGSPMSAGPESKTAAPPHSPARAFARARSTSMTAATSAPATRCARFRAWRPPMPPVPITPTRNVPSAIELPSSGLVCTRCGESGTSGRARPSRGLRTPALPGSGRLPAGPGYQRASSSASALTPIASTPPPSGSGHSRRAGHVRGGDSPARQSAVPDRPGSRGRDTDPPSGILAGGHRRRRRSLARASSCPPAAAPATQQPGRGAGALSGEDRAVAESCLRSSLQLRNQIP